MQNKQIMKKLILALALVMLFGLSVKAVEGATAITNCNELQNIRNNLAGDYYLANDMYCGETFHWNDGAGFEPIGPTVTNSFTGTFDGRNHTISGLHINRSSSDCVGLFGHVGSGAEIKNVGLVDVDIKGHFSVGGLVGYNEYGIINNSYVTSASDVHLYGVSGSGNVVGGLVGNNIGGTIDNSYSTTLVSTSGNWSGGLVGNNWNGTIKNSYSTGSVSGTEKVGGLVGRNVGTVSKSYSTGSVNGSNYVGGLVGYNGLYYNNNYYPGTVSNSYSTGNVNAYGNNVGGLVGFNRDGIIKNSYSTGNVNAYGNNVGGLVGFNDDGTTISDSYSTGSVSGTDRVGGLVGYNYYGAVSNSFYNNHAGNPSNCFGYGSGDCTAIQDNEAYFYIINNEPMAQWNFNSVWSSANNGLYPPILRESIFCNKRLVQKGNHILNSDLLNCPGDGLVIGANDITLDCAGHTIDGTNNRWGINGYSYGGRKIIKIKNCNIKEFTDGIYLGFVNGGIIENNNISSNFRGIVFHQTKGLNIAGNRIYNNTYTFYMDASDLRNSVIYNNYFDRKTFGGEAFYNTTWNIPKKVGTSIIGTPYISGNYFAPYAGWDNDDDRDWIGQDPLYIEWDYYLDNYAKDYGPLTFKYAPYYTFTFKYGGNPSNWSLTKTNLSTWVRSGKLGMETS